MQPGRESATQLKPDGALESSAETRITDSRRDANDDASGLAVQPSVVRDRPERQRSSESVERAQPVNTLPSPVGRPVRERQRLVAPHNPTVS
jgi:hypothetical protein